MDEQRLEQDLHEACERGNLEQALEWALAAYGPEVMRLMGTVLQDYGRSREAFGRFQADLRRELPEFRWQCSFRPWAYRLARNACFQVTRAPPADMRTAGMPGPPDGPARRPPTEAPSQRTSIRERLRALRESLEPKELLLLLLRVDQRLSWREVAWVMFDGNAPPTDEALDREATALRKQFQHLKAHLRTLGMEEGLITASRADAH
ncbi:sigma-70 family RNA polymerase sigma factor [Pyxidicoccus fallax]|uniref:Sigma-70 family RNA polymerase sigma factor n=1 Tax=Pyxidicoccus fallax TaxID=394095 RepID=A0A848LNF1_9BACT|nr:sigma-70 family RNA polymerase sigma factor [Pyxidicoccus fallax]NPC80864.1 sigma-70 family RNA polymerase sigma factor [Pyxidicoccus fallax]